MNFEKIRKENNLTQVEVAKLINSTQATLSSYESGRTEPDLGTLIKLADAYNVSVDALLGHKTLGLSDFGYLSPEQRTAVNILLNLPESNFYEYLGRLKTTADLLKIEY